MISKYYILKNSVYFRKRTEVGSVGAAEQEGIRGQEAPESFQQLWWAPAPPGSPSSEQAAPPAGPAEEAGSRDWGWRRRQQAAHAVMYRERGHLALDSSLNPWPVPRRHGHQFLGKGWSVQDSDCDTCFQLPGAVPEGGPGAWSGECRGVRARMQGEKMLFQE